MARCSANRTLKHRWKILRLSLLAWICMYSVIKLLGVVNVLLLQSVSFVMTLEAYFVHTPLTYPPELWSFVFVVVFFVGLRSVMRTVVELRNFLGRTCNRQEEPARSLTWHTRPTPLTILHAQEIGSWRGERPPLELGITTLTWWCGVGNQNKPKFEIKPQFWWYVFS